MTLTATQRRLIEQVVPGQGKESGYGTLDPAVTTDREIARLVATGCAEELRGAIDVVLDTADQPHWPAYTLDAPFEFVEAPESHDALRWLRAVRARVAEIELTPSIVPPPPSGHETGFEPPRAGWWTGPDPTAEVIDGLRPLLDEWMSEPTWSTWFRRHFLVDVGREIGRVAPLVGQGSDMSVDRDRAVPTSNISVIVEREVAATRSRRDEYDLHTWRVVFSRPELPLDPAVRHRFPDLCHLFGGYFGQPFDDEHGWPAAMSAQAMERTSGAARDRMRDQLAELLRIESDDELIATVGHLGSYCLPSFMRHWIDRLHWKIDALDWGPPVLPRDDSPPLPHNA